MKTLKELFKEVIESLPPDIQTWHDLISIALERIVHKTVSHFKRNHRQIIKMQNAIMKKTLNHVEQLKVENENPTHEELNSVYGRVMQSLERDFPWLR